MLEAIGKTELEDFIWNSHLKNKVIVLYVGADWCGPCKSLKKRLESDEGKEEMPNLSVVYIDVDKEDNTEIGDLYKVKGLPTQIFVKLDENEIVMIKTIIGYDWINFRLTYTDINNSNRNNKKIANELS